MFYFFGNKKVKNLFNNLFLMFTLMNHLIEAKLLLFIRILKDIEITEKRTKTIIHLMGINVILMMKVINTMDIEIFGGFIFQEGEDND